jgi:glycosyltransferase involved in cell wall biosynthesis
MDERLGSYFREIQSVAAALGVAREVEFTGFVDASRMKTLYATADVFLCTSEHEGFCVPLVEAMWFRVPIVAWGVTAVGETVGNSGLVFEEWDEGEMATAIAAVVENADLAASLGDLGRLRYQETFKPSRLREKLCGLIAGMAGQIGGE